MEFRVLGPLEVADGDRFIPVAGKQRALLAVLLVHANEVVSADRLIDALWGERPPATAQTALQVHVSQLRKLLGAVRIETRAPGYRLVVDESESDCARFERLLEEGRAEEALRLWRGPPWAEFEYEPWAMSEIARLEELRLAAEEDRIAAALTRGETPIAELESLVRSHPLRERPRADLMRALYRAGRQADALALYRETRKTLVEELGIEPGPELQDVYKQILNQDRALAPLVMEPPQPAESRREERKIVTVLFCDLVGFTSRAEQLDPEDVNALLSRFHVRLRAELERFGGMVEKFVGDAVMALFGAPVAHEDDAERAVRAALAIRDWIAESEPDLQVRSGVATGEALVRLAASPAEGEAMAVGDVVNTAARLQQVAPQGAILVSEQTYRATRRTVAYERIDPVEVKGKAEPVAVWLAKAVREAADDVERPTSPFVGRTEELALLQQTYARAVRERSAQLVTIVGEPGIGKTRLLSEFRSSLEAGEGEAIVRHGRCLAYGDGITFWALGQIVKEQAGVLESDSPDVAAQKLRSALSAIAVGADEQWLYSRVAPLVGAAQTEAAEQEESFAAWRAFLEGIAATQPLVLLVEDLHWADSALLEFVEGLVELVTDVPLVVVGTARPELFERATGWGGGKRNTTTIALGPLSDAETSAVIAELLVDTALPEETHVQLLERAGGNPLYAEEFMRLLADRRLLSAGGEIAVPEGVQAVIAARLDTLPPERKELVHAASVIGKVFWGGALAAMTRASKESVLANLRELGRKELVRRVRMSSIADENEYLFWHVLVRDVAYAQIPRAERTRLHVAAAQWIERIAGDRVTDHAEFLAHHYRTAVELSRASGDDETAERLLETAVRFGRLAAERALRLDQAQGERYYRQTLELLPLDHPLRPRLLADAADVRTHSGTAPFDQIKAELEEAIAGLREQGDVVGAGAAMTKLAYSMWVHGESEDARISLADEARRLLETQPEGRELALAHFQLAWQYTQAARYRDALEWIERGIPLLERFGLRDEAVRLDARRSMMLAHLGRTTSAEHRERMRAALDPASELATYTQIVVYTNLGHIEFSIGNGPRAAADAWRAESALAVRRGHARPAMFSKALLGEPLYELGEWDELLEVADEIRSWEASRGHGLIGTMSAPFAARALAARGDLDSAEELIEDLLPRVRRVGDPENRLPALVAAAAVAHARGDIKQAVHFAAEYEDSRPRHPSTRNWQTTLSRIALAIGDSQLLERLAVAADERGPWRTNVLRANSAAVAESRTSYADAEKLYAEVATRWAELECIVEQAHALVGVARCRIALGIPEDASEPLREAQEIFERLRAELWLGKLRALAPHSPARS